MAGKADKNRIDKLSDAARALQEGHETYEIADQTNGERLSLQLPDAQHLACALKRVSDHDAEEERGLWANVIPRLGGGRQCQWPVERATLRM